MKKKNVILIGLATIVLCAWVRCSGQNHFNLDSPPDDWYRFVDPGYNTAVWLPDSWDAVVWDVTGSDVSVPTYYHPTGEDTDTEVWIDVIPPVDFREDYCIPQMNDCGDPPVETYDIQAGDIAVPCARYDQGSFRWRHICVVGFYSGQQFHPESVGGKRSVMFSLQTNDDWEAQVVPVWKNIVISFILEQLPGNE